MRGLPLDRSARQAAAAVDLSSTCPAHAQLLVDTSPDLRQQALDARHHARRRGALHAQPRRSHPRASTSSAASTPCRAAPMPCYADAGDVGRHCARRFTTSSTACRGWAAASRSCRSHEIDGPLARRRRARGAGAAVARPACRCSGFRFGGFAYLTDCNRLDDAAWPLLEGVDTLVIDALRDKPHATHFTRGRGAGRDRAARAAPRVHHPHDPRSRARRDQRAPAGRRRAGI